MTTIDPNTRLTRFPDSGRVIPVGKKDLMTFSSHEEMIAGSIKRIPLKDLENSGGLVWFHQKLAVPHHGGVWGYREASEFLVPFACVPSLTRHIDDVTFIIKALGSAGVVGLRAWDWMTTPLPQFGGMRPANVISGPKPGAMCHLLDLAHRFPFPVADGISDTPNPAMPREPMSFQQANPSAPAWSCLQWSTRGTVLPNSRKFSVALSCEVKRLDPICRYCMERPSVTADHVWPRTRGGCNHLHNLVGACQECNERKSHFFAREVGMILHMPLRFFDNSPVAP